MTTGSFRPLELLPREFHTSLLMNLPAPPFDVHGLTELAVSPVHIEAFSARLNLIAAMKELHDLVLGPKESLRHLAWDVKSVPIVGNISYTDLAKKVNTDSANLRRLIRHAITNHIFCKPRPGYIVPTSSSRLLAEDPQMQAWVGFMSEDLTLPVSHAVDAIDKWPGFQIANDTTDTFFLQHLAKHQGRLKRYGTSVAANAASEGYHVKHLVDNYAWESFGQGTVVNLDGSQGQVSIAIAAEYPSLKFVIQELPSKRPHERFCASRVRNPCIPYSP